MNITEVQIVSMLFAPVSPGPGPMQAHYLLTDIHRIVTLADIPLILIMLIKCNNNNSISFLTQHFHKI